MFITSLSPTYDKGMQLTSPEWPDLPSQYFMSGITIGYINSGLSILLQYRSLWATAYNTSLQHSAFSKWSKSIMASKRARPSPMWDFMERFSPTLVKWIVCNSHLSYNKCTSTMMKHLKTKHPIEFNGSFQTTPPQPTGTTINITDNGHGQQGQVVAPEVGLQPYTQPMLKDVFSKREVYKYGGHKK